MEILKCDTCTRNARVCLCVCVCVYVIWHFYVCLCVLNVITWRLNVGQRVGPRPHDSSEFTHVTRHAEDCVAINVLKAPLN